MMTVYAQTESSLLKLAENLTRKGAKLFIDGLMAAAPNDKRPKITVYRFNKFAYSRTF